MRSRTPVNDYRMVIHIWLNFLLPDLKKKKGYPTPNHYQMPKNLTTH